MKILDALRKSENLVNKDKQTSIESQNFKATHQQQSLFYRVQYMMSFSRVASVND